MSLGSPELILVLVVLLMMVGAKQLPALAKALGRSIREFRTASLDADEHGIR